MTPKILFIGGGNITAALVRGLIANNYPAQAITVLDRHPEKLETLKNSCGIHTVQSIQELKIQNIQTDLLVLSFKPFNAKETCLELSTWLENSQNPNPLILSVMTGIQIKNLENWLGNKKSIIRAMPNTPCLVQAGATGLFGNNFVSENQKKQTEVLFSAVGIISWLQTEAQIDDIIALSGSGPAYFFYFMELMQNTAIQMGLSPETAIQLAKQTAYGAAKLAMESPESVEMLRKRITSKGGTTEAALSVFQNGLPDLIQKAMEAARDRAIVIKEMVS